MSEQGLGDKTWYLKEWNAVHSLNGAKRLPMNRAQINQAVDFLRGSNYPKPADCPWEKCIKLRPTCKAGVCNIAVGMCGDL